MVNNPPPPREPREPRQPRVVEPPDDGKKTNPIVIVLLAIIATLFGVGAVTTVAVNNQEKPIGFATAMFGPDVQREANYIIYDDRIEVQEIEYDDEGHAELPDWEPSTPLDLPINVIPLAPTMGWNTNFFQAVANKERSLRYCLDSRRAYDAANGKQTAEMGVRAIRAVFDVPFDILPSQEVPCNQADLVLGANAEAPIDQGGCGSMDAYGCANVRFPNGRAVVTITFNGTLHSRGDMPDACIEYGIDWHELKHAADLGHTGAYGGEGRPHAHASDLGFIGGNCRPVDNSRSNRPAIEDFYAPNGHENRWGLEFRDAPNPNPEPTPSPSPTPSPTPQPTPPPQQTRYLGQLWIEYKDSNGCPPPNIASADRAWCFSPTVPIGQDGYFGATITITPNGEAQYQFQLIDQIP